MYIVEYCPEDLFRPGATFTTSNFDFTLEIGAWPEGIIFTDRGRRVVIQNGRAVEIKANSQGEGEHRLPLSVQALEPHPGSSKHKDA
jgi:hypothetical protein